MLQHLHGSKQLMSLLRLVKWEGYRDWRNLKDGLGRLEK